MVVYTQEELAKLFGVKPLTVRRWRQSGEGPPWVQVSDRRVLYLKETLSEWMKSREHLTFDSA